MTKNINGILLKKSKRVTNGLPILPTSDKLMEGELAVNYAKGVETLSMKNESGEVITFSSDDYYTSKKLGSGFTGVNSANTVTSVIKENERVVSSALNDLKKTKLDASAYTPTDLSDYYTKSQTSGATELSTEFGKYYTKSQTSGATEISTALSAKASANDLTAHTNNSSIHLSSTEKTNIDALATNIGTISGITSTKVSNWDTAYTNNHTHSNKTYLDGITSSVGTMAYQNTGSYSSATQVNTALGNKADKSSLNVYADSVKYNTTSKYVEFFHGGTGGTKVFEFDASPFIIDGMVNNVEIKDITISGELVTCLVVSFNTDAGKQDINIPITEIFDANNYYTKSETSGATEISTALSAKANASHNHASSAVTAMTGYAIAASGTAITTADTLNQAIGKLEKQNYEIVEFIETKEQVIAAAITELDKNKLDASAYTPTDLSNYYTKSQTSGASEISTALNGKSNTGHTHTLSNITDVTASVAAVNSLTGTVGTMAFQNTSSYSSATQVNTALSAKANTATTISTASGLTGGGNLSANRTIGLAATGTAGTYYRVVTDEYGRVTSGNTVDNNTWRGIKVNGTNFLTDTSTALSLSGGSNVTLSTGATGLLTISATDTKYTAANTAPPKVDSSSASGTSSNYARQDHTHGIDLATGDSNGQVKIAGTNVSVKGLASAAYLNTGTTSGTVAVGNHHHDGTYAKNTFSRISVNSTNIDADTTGDTFTITAGTFVSLTGDVANDKMTIDVLTGTTSSTLARGDHQSHYWANLQTSNAANYITEPEIKSVKINGSSTNEASTNNCQIQYDTTNKCLKFLFN